MFYLFQFSNKSLKIKIIQILDNSNPKSKRYVVYDVKNSDITYVAQTLTHIYKNMYNI